MVLRLPPNFLLGGAGVAGVRGVAPVSPLTKPSGPQSLPPFAVPTIPPSPSFPLGRPAGGTSISAPGLGTSLAVTQALERGNWELLVVLGVQGTGELLYDQTNFNFRHRPNAGAADWNLLLATFNTPFRARFHAENGDVFDVLTVGAASAATQYLAAIWVAGPF